MLTVADLTKEDVLNAFPEDWTSHIVIADQLGVSPAIINIILVELEEEGCLRKEGSNWRKISPMESRADAEASDYPKEEWIDPSLIILDCGTQSRLFEFNQEKLDDYAADMKSGEWDMERRPLPEVTLAPDGRYYATDCHHRVKAAIQSLLPGQSMLFLVRKGTLPQARVWSAAANTMHGLGADNSPQGVRKRIEMFLDNISELSPEDYKAEFFRVPDLSAQEKKHGRFSSRTIARYLRLRPGQDRTVSNIMKEREIAVKISQFNVGDRIEVFLSAKADSLPKGFEEGDAGTIQSKDKKVGLWVRWDKLPTDAPFPINPDFVKPSDKPKPEAPTLAPVAKAKATGPVSISGSAPNGGSVAFTGKNQRQILPDTDRNEDATAYEELTPSVVSFAPKSEEDVNLVAALTTVVNNIHLLSTEELEVLESAIANFKQDLPVAS